MDQNVPLNGVNIYVLKRMPNDCTVQPMVPPNEQSLCELQGSLTQLMSTNFQFGRAVYTHRTFDTVAKIAKAGYKAGDLLGTAAFVGGALSASTAFPLLAVAGTLYGAKEIYSYVTG